jgi:hypothetical protein
MPEPNPRTTGIMLRSDMPELPKIALLSLMRSRCLVRIGSMWESVCDPATPIAMTEGLHIGIDISSKCWLTR